MTVRILILVWALAVILVRTQSPSAPADLPLDQLATGPYSRMHMLLEKTIFNVDVLTVDLQFGAETQQRLRMLAADQRYSEQLAGRIAEAVLEAPQAYVTLEFERDVAFNRWLDGVRQSLETAWRAGMIAERNYRNVSESLPRWFDVILQRGFHEGDRLLYRVHPNRMRTLLVSNDGRTLVDQVDHGDDPRRALLAGYLAPGTDFREPLIRSLFQD